MEWQLRDTSPCTGTALLVTVGDADAADVAVRAGADLLDVGPATPAAIEEIRGRHPEVGLAAPWRSPGPTGHPAVVLPPATGLICDDVQAAEAALEAGAPRETILVAVPPDRVRVALAAGWTVVADADRAGSGPGQPAVAGQITAAQQIGNPAQAVTASDENLGQQSRAGREAQAGASEGGPAEGAAPGAGAGEVSAVVAVAAVSAWLGVAAVRTRHVPQVRRALDMTASIKGIRPPAWTVRALG